MKHRIVTTDAEAIALGFSNIASYRAAVRVENEREARRQHAEDVAKRGAALTAKLQPAGSGTQIRPQLISDEQKRSQNILRGIAPKESGR